jgi:hypothetical protein
MSSRSPMSGLRRPLLAAAGLACVVLVSAADAQGATRLRVDWSAPSQHDFSPRINLYSSGGLSGSYNGPCSGPGNCSAGGGFHWEEANPNAGGYYQTISLVDDQPAQRRRVCFEIGHPYAADFPGERQYQVTVQVTDPNGAPRTRTFTLSKGQTTQAECSPAAQPRGQLGKVRPPAWWTQASRLIRARGGRCARSTEHIQGQDPITGERRTTYTETFTACRHRVPKRLFVRWGGNPAAPNPSESCSSIVSNGNPLGDGYSFICTLFGARRARGNPIVSAWRCQRFKHLDLQTGDGRSDRAWTAQRRPRGFENRVRSLRRCVTRRPKR